jgi:holin-like protein
VKYLKQFGLILLFTLLGELCRFLIPFPIPASIYGMVLLFAALGLKIIKLPDISDAGGWLVSILPVLFVAPAVNLLSSWDALKNAIVPILVVMIATTVIVFAVAGLVTQWILKGKKEDEKDV